MKLKDVILLDRYGEISSLNPGNKKSFFSGNVLPIVADYYIWDLSKQTASAEKYKDQIKRVFYQEQVDDRVKVMLGDDVRRLDLVQDFSYGQRILEVGSSDGSVSIKIAHQAKVKEILAIDLRQSAILDGKKLIKDLVKRGELKQTIADKIKLKKCAIESLLEEVGQFDSVCAYEIFEHLSPWDMMPVFKHLYQFIKPNGKFFISVPNRFPAEKYEKEGRSRWKWFDHRNFFSLASLEAFLTCFFKSVKFYPLYPNESPEKSLYLIAECHGKKF